MIPVQWEKDLQEKPIGDQRWDAQRWRGDGPGCRWGWDGFGRAVTRCGDLFPASVSCEWERAQGDSVCGGMRGARRRTGAGIVFPADDEADRLLGTTV